MDRWHRYTKVSFGRLYPSGARILYGPFPAGFGACIQNAGLQSRVPEILAKICISDRGGKMK